MTVEEIQAFENDIAECFNNKQIRAPIHLDGGNEEHLIEIFKNIKPDDWVCGSWRMHAKCLLHGAPPEKLKNAILSGKSITLCFPEHRIISSAIVGGILPIALGIAWSIKYCIKTPPSYTQKVWCFLGDMTATSGIFHECFQYARGHDLPIQFVVEDNGLSVCTRTMETWGIFKHRLLPQSRRIKYFTYELKWPHAGAGVRVQF